MWKMLETNNIIGFITLLFGVFIGYYLSKIKFKSKEISTNLLDTKKNKASSKFDNEEDIILQIVARSEIKMGKGKIAAQVGHAVSGTIEFLIRNPRLWNSWKKNGQPKIVLKATNDEIDEMLQKAQKSGIHIYKVYDAGRTQVKSGSNTVIAIGPAPKNLLNMITGSLKLL